MTVPIRIQHAAGRELPLARLLATLPPAGDSVQVMRDEGPGPPNPWRGYQLCLSDLPDTSHVCVLQDDTIACPNLPEALELIAAANPENPVCLFLGGLPRRTAIQALRLHGRRRYVDLVYGDFMPVVAVLWPTHVAAGFMDWVNENPLRLPRPPLRSDDAAAGRWFRYTRNRVRCTIPSLVEHPDDVPSTIGRKHRSGGDKGRVAANFIGDDNPLDLDWG